MMPLVSAQILGGEGDSANVTFNLNNHNHVKLRYSDDRNQNRKV
jgi:hypothetical protein